MHSRGIQTEYAILHAGLYYDQYIIDASLFAKR
jgi:hypothetical protein